MDAEISDAGFTEALKYLRSPNAGDEQLAVRFYTDEVEDPAASKTEGRPIFKTVECCEIRVPGDPLNIRRGPCKGMHPDPRQRFPAAYAKFRAGAKEQVTGTLLREWGLMPRTRALEYQHFGVITVEQLAGLDDNNAQNIRGAMTDRQKAQDFLALTKGQAPLAQARALEAELRQQLAALQDVVKEQGDRIEKLTKKKGKAAEAEE